MVGCVRWLVVSDGWLCQMIGCVRLLAVSDSWLCQMIGGVRWLAVSDGWLNQIVGSVRWLAVSDGVAVSDGWLCQITQLKLATQKVSTTLQHRTLQILQTDSGHDWYFHISRVDVWYLQSCVSEPCYYSQRRQEVFVGASISGELPRIKISNFSSHLHGTNSYRSCNVLTFTVFLCYIPLSRAALWPTSRTRSKCSILIRRMSPTFTGWYSNH